MYLSRKPYLKLHQKKSTECFWKVIEGFSEDLKFERHGEHNLVERGERVSETDMQRSSGEGAQAVGNAGKSRWD